MCSVAGDCKAQSTLCILNTCAGGCCGTMNATQGATCMDNSGAVCDGNGTCVACNVAADCGSTGTVCKTATCTGNACGTMNAVKGTACTDNNGVVCDGAGTCVAMHCMDTVKDADETDVDCGGKDCSPCPNTDGCLLARDCVSGFCDMLFCAPCGTDGDCPPPADAGAPGSWCDPTNNGGTCTPTKADGQACGGVDQCTSGFCANGVCCDSACTATCQACTFALTGQSDGTCSSQKGGTTAPAGQCTASPPCGNDGKCAPGGVCEQASNTVPCGTPSCSGNIFTPIGTCSGTGTCNSTPVACQGATPDCNSALGCVACNVNGDCAAASCNGNTFTAAATCNASHVCVAGSQTTCSGADAVCNVALGCVQCNITADCPASVAACGATACTSGSCVYPGNSVAPPNLQTPGDCQKVVCNGSGGATSVNDPTDLPTSNSECLINPSCCGPSPLTPCFNDAPTGTSCTSASDPAAHVCGDTSASNIAGTCVECNDDADCLAVNDAGTLTCDTATGVCQ